MSKVAELIAVSNQRAYISEEKVFRMTEKDKTMERFTIPNTNLQVTRLCAGTMGLGGGWGVDTELTREHERQAHEFLDTAITLGINFFDHADIYARGRSETVFGRVLQQRAGLREQIVLQSKCGIRWANDPPGSPQRYDFSAEHILASVDGILRRLCTDYLDILLLHRPDALGEPEEVARAFDELKKCGKVRHFGVSNQNRFQMEYLQSFLSEPLVANQVQMSLLCHGFAESGISFNQGSSTDPGGWEGLIQYCRIQGVSLQAWRPLDKGALTGGDVSKLTESGRRTAELLRSMAQIRDVPVEAVALAWLLRHPGNIVPVLGTIRPERLRACARALDFQMTREEWYALFEAVRGQSMP